ncbi:MAG: hypothetical protein KDK51_02650 [Deltaproteobacteria bacterium]|nr:hypothetical protein [Deltaproteobacteria bacterium]
MNKNTWIHSINICYNGGMKTLLIVLVLALPSSIWAKIPTPSQINQQQANVYGTYTGAAGTWGYSNTDPYLATRNFGASNSYQQFGAEQQRMSNLVGIGVNLIDVFTSEGTFGEKVKYLAMKELKRRVTDPLSAQFQAKAENMTLEQLYALANAGQQPTNPYYSQCVDCINQNPNAWQPTYSNPHAVGNQFSQFTQGNAGNQGLGGVVTPIP